MPLVAAKRKATSGCSRQLACVPPEYATLRRISMGTATQRATSPDCKVSPSEESDQEEDTDR